MMRNPEDAADALQDAYIAAFRRAGSFRGEAKVTTWLHRVVVNACLDRLRSQKVRAADPLPEDLDRVAGPGDAEPATRVEEQQERDRIAAAMAVLNPDQRAALVLVDMEGYSVEEAATILGCAAGTVKSRCARGRARLAPLLARGSASAPSESEHSQRGPRRGDELMAIPVATHSTLFAWILAEAPHAELNPGSRRGVER